MTVVKQSYVKAVKDSPLDDSNTSIKEVIRKVLREEYAEETNKQKRVSNVIVPEQDISMNKSWVDDLIKETNSNLTVKRVTRLGKTSADRKRPTLICLSSKDEKLNLLGNLLAFKGNDKFSRVITEDL
eukprot:TCONS_00026065-protein